MLGWVVLWPAVCWGVDALRCAPTHPHSTRAQVLQAGGAGGEADGQGQGQGQQRGPGGRVRGGGLGAGRVGGGSAGREGPLPQPSPEALQQLEAMGFDRVRATRALQQTGNDVNAAIAMLV